MLQTTKYTISLVPIDILDPILPELTTEFMLNLQALQITTMHCIDKFIADINSGVFDNCSSIEEPCSIISGPFYVHVGAASPHFLVLQSCTYFY